MWVLVYWIIASSGVTTGQVEFTSHEACQRAHQAFDYQGSYTRLSTCLERD